MNNDKESNQAGEESAEAGLLCSLEGLIKALERKALECDVEKWHTKSPDRATIAGAQSTAFLAAADMARRLHNAPKSSRRDIEQPKHEKP